MATFHDMIKTHLESFEDEAEIPTIFDDLSSAYDTAFTGWQNTVDEQKAAVAEKAAEIDRLKATNYDLLTQIPSNAGIVDESKENSEQVRTFESLFTNK